MSHELNIPLKEKLKTIPEFFGIRVNEEPDYEVLQKDGDIEIRKYPELLLAKVSIGPTRSIESFKEIAFKSLANYIFQGNDETKSIAMTAPVLLGRNEFGDWEMSFVLPKELDLTTAPNPDDSKVVLCTREPQMVAVISYSGNDKVQNIKKHERKLSEWLKDQPNIQTSERFFIAEYDAPFVIPFMKKNEIHVRVDHIH